MESQMNLVNFKLIVVVEDESPICK